MAARCGSKAPITFNRATSCKSDTIWLSSLWGPAHQPPPHRRQPLRFRPDFRPLPVLIRPQRPVRRLVAGAISGPWAAAPRPRSRQVLIRVHARQNGCRISETSTFRWPISGPLPQARKAPHKKQPLPSGTRHPNRPPHLAPPRAPVRPLLRPPHRRPPSPRRLARHPRQAPLTPLLPARSAAREQAQARSDQRPQPPPAPSEAPLPNSRRLHRSAKGRPSPKGRLSELPNTPRPPKSLGQPHHLRRPGAPNRCRPQRALVHRRPGLHPNNLLPRIPHNLPTTAHCFVPCARGQACNPTP